MSSEVSVSDDEEDKQNFSSYDDSFIDDRINPTAADSQAEAGEVDMISIYRRSLLSQSPILNISTDYTPDSEVQTSRVDESKSSSGTADHDAPQTDPKSITRNSSSFQQNIKRISPEVMPCSITFSLRENDGNLESRKRKLSYCQTTSLPVVNLQNEFSRHSTAAGENLHLSEEAAENAVCDPFDDDLFYQSIDFDAVEAEATRMLRNKPQSLVKNTVTSITVTQIPDGIDAPSFDLGI